MPERDAPTNRVTATNTSEFIAIIRHEGIYVTRSGHLVSLHVVADGKCYGGGILYEDDGQTCYCYWNRAGRISGGEENDPRDIVGEWAGGMVNPSAPRIQVECGDIFYDHDGHVSECRPTAYIVCYWEAASGGEQDHPISGRAWACVEIHRWDNWKEQGFSWNPKSHTGDHHTVMYDKELATLRKVGNVFHYLRSTCPQLPP